MSSNNQLTPSVYSALSIDAAIRLLKVQQARISYQLRTSLYEARLESIPKYGALSYQVWRDMTSTELIDCGGHTMRISKWNFWLND